MHDTLEERIAALEAQVRILEAANKLDFIEIKPISFLGQVERYDPVEDSNFARIAEITRCAGLGWGAGLPSIPLMRLDVCQRAAKTLGYQLKIMGGDSGPSDSDLGRLSDYPCDKCGAQAVRVKEIGDSCDCRITCHGCGHSYRVDGIDS